MRLRITLFAVLLAIGIVVAIRPYDRSDWLLENVLVVLGLAGLWFTRKWLPLTDLSIWLIFVFLVLHEIGSHYTYALVPYDEWFEALFGRTLNSLFGAERNHFDRLVHFLCGFLLAVPMRELFLRVVQARGFASYWLPFQMTMSCSALYELMEWLSVLLFGGDLGAAFLGTQGDEWDAHKDMALAGLGAAIAMGILAAVQRARGRDEQREWLERRVPGLRERFD
jgi:putative membrane protein